jgi:hypothetical protein
MFLGTTYQKGKAILMTTKNTYIPYDHKNAKYLVMKVTNALKILPTISFT